VKRKFLILIFFLVLVISILNKIGGDFFLYWKFWWYDIVMHFLGGVAIGFIALWYYYFSGYIKKINKKIPFIYLYTFIVVFSVGIGWEVFEFLLEVDFSNNYIPDTSLDLIMDILGSVSSVWFFLKFIKIKNIIG